MEQRLIHILLYITIIFVSPFSHSLRAAFSPHKGLSSSTVRTFLLLLERPIAILHIISGQSEVGNGMEPFFLNS